MVILQKRTDKIASDASSPSMLPTCTTPDGAVYHEKQDQHQHVAVVPPPPPPPPSSVEFVPTIIGTGNHDYMYLLAPQGSQMPSFKRQKTSTSSSSSSSSSKVLSASAAGKFKTTPTEGSVAPFMVSSSPAGVVSPHQQLSPCDMTMEIEGTAEGGYNSLSSPFVDISSGVPTVFFDDEYVKMNELVQQMKESFEENAEVLVSIDQTVADILASYGDEGTEDAVQNIVVKSTMPKVGGDALVSTEGRKKRKRKEKLEPTVCKICNRTFTTRRGYNRHKAIHPKSARAAKGLGPVSDDDDGMDLAA